MTVFRPLSRSFFKPSASQVAPALLGHLLLRKTSAGYCGGPIVETEAYLWDDPACHAAPGPTPRNEVMFGAPGHAYVYFIYGVHYCVNAVCCPPGKGEALLIRAIEPLYGMEFMLQNRPSSSPAELTSGHGKLCQALGIGSELNGSDLCDADSSLFIAQNPGLKKFLSERGPTSISKRIGLTKAADLPLRFFVNSSSLSRRSKLR